VWTQVERRVNHRLVRRIFTAEIAKYAEEKD